MQADDLLQSLPPEAREELLKQVAQLLRQQRQADEIKRYQTEDGIVAFVRDVLHADPALYQERILRALVRYRRVAAYGPHGLGKSTVASWAVLWMLFAFRDDVKAVTTASNWRQLSRMLWPAIRMWARRADLPEMARILDLIIKVPGKSKEAFAAASDQPEALEGVHAKSVLYILDESKAIIDATWDSIEGAFSTGDCYALAISTPGDTSGRFYDICSRKPGYEDWHVIHVTLQECLDAGRLNPAWVEQRKKQWGEQSSVFINRALGEFAKDSPDGLIPLSWIEAANERWHAKNGRGDKDPVYGCDPARYGTDKTAIAKLAGPVLEKLDFYAQEDTMQTVGRLTSVMDKDTHIGIDAIGIGAGVYDRLNELDYKNAVAVNVSESAKDTDGKPYKDRTGTFEFYNLRSYVWWLLRERLDPAGDDPLALLVDDRLTGDLVAVRYGYTSKGLIRVESKDDLRKRIGRSTDGGDAVGLAVYVQQLQDAIKRENGKTFMIQVQAIRNKDEYPGVRDDFDWKTRTFKSW